MPDIWEIFRFCLLWMGQGTLSARRRFCVQIGGFYKTFSNVKPARFVIFWYQHHDLPAFSPYEFGDMMPDVTVAIVDNIKERSCLKVKKKHDFLQ